MKLSALKAKI